MKKLLSLVLALVIIVCVVPFGAFTFTASAAAYYTSGFYTYTVSNGKATITDVSTSISGDVNIPSKLGGYPVTSIGEYSFEYCRNLIRVIIPNGVTNICNNAFWHCFNLINVTIPNSVTGIGDNAFYNCMNLKSVTIPHGVTSIGGGTFELCRSLTNVVIPNSVTSIGVATFRDCTSITNIIIPDGVTSMGNAVFMGCSGLTSITIPDSVTSIGGAAFRGCSSLNIYYRDSKAKKAKISIGKSYNDSLNNVTWYYNSCIGSKNHKYKNTAVLTKATLKKNGSISQKCAVCQKTDKGTIKYAKSFKLTTTSYTYNGKIKTPGVIVKDSAGKTLKKNTDYTVSYAKGRKNVGTYKVTVKMKGKYSGTKTLTFKIVPVKTKVAKLTAGKKSITINISKKSTQVSGYQVQYSTSKKFTSTKTKTISSYKTTKYTLKSLGAKKTYYVRVRTYKTLGGKKYYSGWSTVKSVKTK